MLAKTSCDSLSRVADQYDTVSSMLVDGSTWGAHCPTRTGSLNGGSPRISMGQVDAVNWPVPFCELLPPDASIQTPERTISSPDQVMFDHQGQASTSVSPAPTFADMSSASPAMTHPSKSSAQGIPFASHSKCTVPPFDATGYIERADDTSTRAWPISKEHDVMMTSGQSPTQRNDGPPRSSNLMYFSEDPLACFQQQHSSHNLFNRPSANLATVSQVHAVLPGQQQNTAQHPSTMIETPGGVTMNVSTSPFHAMVSHHDASSMHAFSPRAQHVPMQTSNTMQAVVHDDDLNAARQAWADWRGASERETPNDTRHRQQLMGSSLSGILSTILMDQKSIDSASLQGSGLTQHHASLKPQLSSALVFCSNCTMPVSPSPNPASPCVCTFCKRVVNASAGQLLVLPAASTENAEISRSPIWDGFATRPSTTFPSFLQDPTNSIDMLLGSSVDQGFLGPPSIAQHDTAYDRNSIDSSILLDKPATPPQKSLTRGSANMDIVTEYDAQGALPVSDSDVVLGYDDRMLLHGEQPSVNDFGLLPHRDHPERPARLTSIMQMLHDKGLTARCRKVPGRVATDEELEAVHDAELVKQIAAASNRLQPKTEPATSIGAPSSMSYDYETQRWIMDCPLNSHTNTAARIAAGTAVDVSLAVAQGNAKAGAAIIRPPGHHAESALSMGFCIFNNAAVAARAAQKAGCKKVLIMDWDVHHGNGTQHMFLDDATVMYCSTHRYDGGCFYPGTGSPKEVGHGPGAGFNVNVGFDGPGVTDGDILAAFRHVVLPITKSYAPDLAIISAGFDAAQGDPLGECNLSPAVYGHLTQMLSSLGPTVLLLEGGYNLSATAASTAECVRVLLEGSPAELSEEGTQPSLDALLAIRQTLFAHAPYWPVAIEQLHIVNKQITKLQRERAEQEQRAAHTHLVHCDNGHDDHDDADDSAHDDNSSHGGHAHAGNAHKESEQDCDEQYGALQESLSGLEGLELGLSQEAGFTQASGFNKGSGGDALVREETSTTDILIPGKESTPDIFQ